MNHNHTHEAGADVLASSTTGGIMNIRKLRELAHRLTADVDPDYKDEWERGFDAGVASAGRDLQNLLDEGQPTEADIDQEALRIVNSGRYPDNQVQMLDTLNPASQATYRVMARQNLGVGK